MVNVKKASDQDESDSKLIELDKKLSIEERDKLIIYIGEHIDEMSYNDRRDILSMLKMNISDKTKFKQKGDGTQILFKDISNDIVIWIHNRIYSITKI
jgi:hypothetical protein